MRRGVGALVSRLVGVAAATGLAGAGLVAAATPAAAAACSGTSGVTVVVDYGGSTTVACAPGDPGSGLAALSAAGFSVTQVATQPGFVCRINGSPASDPCRNTPPTTAYWSYWHAKRGGSWSYSNVGAGAYDPAPGSVEGWRFGGGSAPSVAPPAPTRTAAPQPTKTAKPTTKPPSTPRTTPRATSTPRRTSTPKGTSSTPKRTTSTPDGTASRSPSATSSPSEDPTPTSSATDSPSASSSASPSGSASPSAGPTTGDGDPGADDAQAAASVTDDGGAGVGTLVAGLGLVLLVGGGAGWTLWRRSRSG